MQDVMYIEIGGHIWKLFDDGHLELLAPGEAVPEGELVVSGALPDRIVNGSIFSSGTSAVTTIFGNVDRNGDELIPKAGFQTYTLPDSREPVETPSTLVQRLSSEAAITIEIDDDENLEDNYVNRFENPSVDFFGTTFEIDDDWMVELALIDSSGQVFTSQAIVVGGVWELPGQNLSPLAEGPFIAQASVTDFYGNRVSSTTTSIKDTLAEGVSVEGDTGDDTIIDMFEAEAAQLSGEFAHVQAGANVDLYVTDIAGTQLKFSSALQADGTWILTGDLTSLAEGTLTLRSETIDLAGNPAEITNTVELFLTPTITVNNDDPDGVFNQYEAPTEIFYGTTLNVEDGQTVTVTVTSSGGGTPLTLTTTVINQTWAIDPYDVSSLSDGTLTITADTVNLAGQPAEAQINWRLDQTADIDARFIDPNTDGVYNLMEAMAASVIGDVIDIEDGQPVAIEARDTAGNVIRGTGVVTNGSWASIDFDVSAAAPGELSLTILGIDVAGNRVNATATIDYDPIAIIDNIADDPADADQLFNLDQVDGITLAGSTDNIEAGQPLTITISDGVNPDVVINTVLVQDATGIWSATGPGTWTTATNGVDISSLNDGDLTVSITGSDVAGNPALGTDTIHKDTVAEITVQFDQVIYDANNVEAATVSGTVTDVERGQVVSVTISDTDGVTPDVTLTGTVGLNGKWTGDNPVDLSSLLDGTLTVEVSVLDVAGNPATATNTAPKDSVTMTIENDDDGVGDDYEYDDGTFNQYESPTTIFYGTTTFVDDGSIVTLTITDSMGATLDQALIPEITVSGNTWSVSDVDVSSLADGTLTVTAEVTNSLGDNTSASLTRELDQTAETTVEFVDNEDFTGDLDTVYNQLEGKTVELTGTVTGVEDDQPVTVTITDSGGNPIAFVNSSGTPINNVAIVTGGVWIISGLDLSAAVPGELTVEAVTIDTVGNTSDAATDSIDYDPNAVIADLAVDDRDGDADQLFNKAEIDAGVVLSGTTDSIDQGSVITVTITDGTNTISFDTIADGVAGTGNGSAAGAGTWTAAIDPTEFLTLDEGDLTVTITGTDEAGNPAEGTDTIHKDTLASIAVQFDGDGQLSASEITAVSISGTTTDIEAGQTVTVTISGGTASDIVFDAIVQTDGTYSSLNDAANTTYDLSGFDDGTLTVDVAVEDLAENPATATNTTIKDVVINIDIDTGDNGLDVGLIRNGTLTDYNGTTDAEDGQIVTLTISDGAISQSQTATVAGGLWVIAGLAPTGLSAVAQWTLTATVEDQAGNGAIDSTPTIIQPSVVTLSEANISVIPDTAISQIRVQIGADPTFNTGPYTFSASDRQTAFDSLTSSDGAGDNTTRVEISNGGKTIQLIRNGDDEVVIEGVIDDASSTVTLTLERSVEQGSNVDVIASSILIQITENDVSGDPNADVVESELRFLVRDTLLEFTVDDAYQVVEAVTSTGNVFDNDNLQEGPLTIQSVDFGGTDYAVSLSSPAVITDATGTLTINSNGEWSFEAARNQDNSVTDPTFTFTYLAKDADGDTDTAEAVITIVDGAAGSVDPQTINSSEADLDTLPGAAVGTGGTTTFTMLAGSDNLDPATITFTPLTITLLEEQSLTSLGEALTYVISENGKTLTAIAVDSGETVFVFTASAVQNGENLDVTGTGVWSRPLDHDNSANDVLELPIAFTANDTDGTPIAVTGSATINFVDGNNPLLSITTAVELDEDDLDSPIDAEGTLLLEVGSDFVESVAFKAGSELSGITSQGEAVTWTISNGGLTMTGSNSLGEVIRVELDSLTPDLIDQQNITYTVTQSQAMDQSNENGGSDGVLGLPFIVEATDSDGDSTDISLGISITDAASGGQIGEGPDLVVGEQPVPGGTTDIYPAQNSDVITVSSGKDPLVSIDFDVVDGSTVLNISPGATSSDVTQNGVALTWRNNGDGTLDALNGNGEVVLRATIPETLNIAANTTGVEIPVAFEILGAVDNLAVEGVPDQIIVPIFLSVTDSDGTVFQAIYGGTVYDGLDPSVNPGPTLTVIEDNIGTSEAVVVGIIGGVRGSDAFASIELDLVTTDITSGGNAVTITQDSVNRWYGVANGENVFQLDIAFDGAVTFTLLKALDHAVPDPEGTAEINNLPLQFSYSTTDADGDVSNTETFTVNVTDDIPEAPIYNENLTFTEYDSFSGNLLTATRSTAAGEFGADGGSIVNVTYDGSDYAVPSGGSVTITLNEPGYGDYGSLEIFSDGRFTVETGALNNLDGSPFSDSYSFDMQDGDEDVVTVPVEFNLVDKAGTFTLTPLETIEDTPVTLSLIGNTGDIDNGEEIASFVITEASLQGGTLTLDGNPLTADASGNIIIDSIVLTGSSVPGEATVAGDLVFTPALNDSNQTKDWTFDITMNIDTDTDPVVVQKDFDFSVVSDADVPLWEADDGTNYQYEIDEDTETALNPTEATLFDIDTSEVLSYRVTAIDAGLTLLLGGVAITLNQELSAEEFEALTARGDDNLSGEFTFTAEAISTEQENGDQATASQIFTVDVAGVADVPTLYVRNIKGTEDVPINLVDAIQGVLGDTDGSEELWFELTLPEGWSIDPVNAPSLQDLGGGVYRVSNIDVLNGATLIPKEDLSQVTEIPSISVQAVSIENPVDGVTPSTPEALSDIRSFTIALKGVADDPKITTGTGDWSYDPDSGVISSNVTFPEDSLVPPGFGIETEDDDGSEEISLHISGLPVGSSLFNSSGEEAFLEIFDASDPNNVIYTVTLAELADLSFKPPQDFSGDVVLNLEQINTEPDGDSASFNLTIEFTITPTVDTEGGQALSSTGLEDQQAVLNLLPELGDVDNSETITELTLQSGFEGVVYLDGSELTVPAEGLALSTLAGGDLQGLLSSGRLTYQAPEDRHGEFTLNFTYEVTDTNGDPAQDDVQMFNGSITIDVTAQVEQSQPTTADDTRLEATLTTLISTGGVAIDLTDQVNFFEEDLDGSETLDYVLIKMPAADGWYVNAPGGAIHDGQGNWLIQTPATSNTVMEQNLSILDGVTINNNYMYTGPIEIEARVLDGDGEDADIITAILNVDFQGVPATIAYDPNTVQIDVTPGVEGQDISFAGHLNTVIRNAGDDLGVDQISIRVTPQDMADAGIPGASITGAGVEVRYALDGTTILAWVFDESSLSSLGITGIDDDFSGDIALTIHVVATDPSGDTIEEEQVLNIDILPVVDELNPVDPFTGKEDQLFNLGFDNLNLLGDDDTDPSRGVESITKIVFGKPSSGTLYDPENVLIDNEDGTFTLENPDDRGKLYYRPPENASINDPDPTSSNVSLEVTLTIVDTTTGGTTQTNSVTAEKTFIISVELEPVTDPADLTVPVDPIIGDEDTHIDLSALSAELIDTDGSEAMSLQIVGGPEGAVMYANGVQLPNNGLDGSGNGTYSWTVTQAQLANLTIVPPQDFAGDITLGLQAVTYEKGTTDFVTTTAEFTVGVNPIADGVQLLNAPTAASTTEGEPVNLNVVAEILEEVDPNEEIELTFTALSSSDGSALTALSRVDVDGTIGFFRNNGDGTFSATVTVAAAALAVGAGGVDLYTGPLAWGNLDLQMDVRSVDSATVAGSEVTDLSDPVTANLSITIAPEPDPALLTRTYDGIIANNGQDIDLAVSITPLNPAPGETNQLVIENLPGGFSFNVGSAEGGNWVVEEADIPNLQLQTGSASGDFSLNLYTRATLNGETATGPSQSMDVKIQEAADGNQLEGTRGDDYYSGTEDTADIFYWNNADEGTALFPANDVVANFERVSGDNQAGGGDILNIDSLLSDDPPATKEDLDDLMDVTENGGDTVFSLRVFGSTEINQVITLQDVSKDTLYDGDSSGVSEADFLQRLVDDNVMITV